MKASEVAFYVREELPEQGGCSEEIDTCPAYYICPGKSRQIRDTFCRVLFPEVAEFDEQFMAQRKWSRRGIPHPYCGMCPCDGVEEGFYDFEEIVQRLNKMINGDTEDFEIILGIGRR